jgi:hypothetical protein
VIPPHVQTSSFRSRPWLRLAFAALLLSMASACAQPRGPVASAPVPDSANETTAAAAFAGRWAYAQSCGWQHSAELELRAAPDGIRGTWNDGTRVRGENGELIGSLRDGKLFLRFCRDADGQASDICPNFGPEESYIARKGEQLAWYRSHGVDGYRGYLDLHRVVAGAQLPTDDVCPEDDVP